MKNHDVNQQCAKLFKQLRRKHGLNQSEASRRLYGNEVTGKQIETNDRVISVYDLWLWSNYFRVPMEKLFVEVKRNVEYSGETV